MDLQLEYVLKEFDGKTAVDIPALTISDGEFFAFVGPSGCGKSTTLNLIAGLEALTKGTLRLGDQALNNLPPHRRDVAFVFQSYALYPHRTVFGNLSFPLEMAKCNREMIRTRVEEVAALLGLKPLLQQYPRQLSGGERQRVALGRAIVRQPKLFLLDEPLSNLDAPLRAQMRKELKRLHRRLKTTFIFVTHDQEEALSLADRVAVMRDGHILQCGTPQEVYDRPGNIFVASFFGLPPMNFTPGQLYDQGSGMPYVEFAGLRLPLQDDPERSKHASPYPVTVGFRPEHLRVSREADAEGLPAEVSLVELRGGVMQLELSLGELQWTVLQAAEGSAGIGEQVRVNVPPSRIHLFDPATGVRL